MNDDGLDQRIGALETELELVKAAIRSGITTGRLAVVDGFGRERIVLDVDQRGTASVVVQTVDRRGDTTGVDIAAGALSEFEPSDASITMLLHGDCISSWVVREDKCS